MPVRQVLTLPHRVLVTPAAEVGRIDGTARDLAADLLETMSASDHCVGLAAPQIGVALRAFAVDVSGHRKARSCHGAFVLFDPVVFESFAPGMAREGCMSVPELTGDVPRATAVTVSGTGIDGRRRTLEVDAFEARAVLHEMDHLDGLVFLDRVSGPHGVFPRKVYR